MTTLILAAALTITPQSWERHIPADGLKVEIDGGTIRQTLAARGIKKGGDGYIRADVPLIRRGTLDFDAKITPPPSNHHMSHFLSLYGIRVFWHDSCRDWRAYFPVRNWEQRQYFAAEPVQHWQIARIDMKAWHHYRIIFDAPGDRVEYFVDDMSDPAFISGDRSVWAEAEFMGGSLCIGGMGGSPGSVLELKNLALTENDGDAVAAERTETLVFDGMANDFYAVPERLKADKPRVYKLVSTQANITPKNLIKYTKLPGNRTVKAAKRIVLVDAPIDPDGIIPPFVIDDIVAAVKDGAELVILEGLFSVDRGGYTTSRLAPLIPPAALSGTCFPKKFLKPEIIEGTFGKGKVKVFRGLEFSNDVEAVRKAFAPWGDKLFGEAGK